MQDHITPLAVTVPDAMVMLGLKRTKVYALIGGGALEARKAGRRTLVLADSVRAYLASLPTAAISEQRKSA